MDLQIKGKVPTSVWKYLFILALICMGVKGGEVSELLV